MTKTEYRQKSWDLAELLPSPDEATVEDRLAEIEGLVERLEARRAALEDGIEREGLVDLLRLYERLTEKAYVLSAYGSLWFSADTQSEPALTFKNRMEQELTRIRNRVLFLSLWWKGLDDEIAARLAPDRAAEPDLAHFLAELRLTRDYVLEERSEQIVNAKDANGIGAVLTLYSMLTNRLEFELEVDGERRRLTRDEATSHVFSPDAGVREAAYREILRVFEAEAKILGQIYVNRVRDWASENVELRGYRHPIAVRNLANDIPDRAVEVLLDVCAESAPIFQRYFRWKADQLGVDKLSRFDLYAPLSTSDRRVPYEEAVEQVLDTFERFDSAFAAKARRVFDDDHIDAEIRKGKKGGAFCATVLPSHTPWLLVNYTGRLRDVQTLAHELGHAVHSLMAEDHSILTQHPSLPLAETASVFAERLLADRLLAEEKDPAVRRELLASSIDDIYATVLRQAFFVRFEVAAHDAVLAGKAPEELAEIYLGLLAEQFGDAVDLAPEFRWEWISIPHIFQTPFYCYAYSFGQLLVLALYRRFQDEGDRFIPGYLRLLAHGGSARPQEILAEVGVDMTDAEFWRGGFAVIEDLVSRLEVD